MKIKLLIMLAIFWVTNAYNVYGANITVNVKSYQYTVATEVPDTLGASTVYYPSSSGFKLQTYIDKSIALYKKTLEFTSLNCLLNADSLATAKTYNWQVSDDGTNWFDSEVTATSIAAEGTGYSNSITTKYKYYRIKATGAAGYKYRYLILLNTSE